MRERYTHSTASKKTYVQLDLNIFAIELLGDEVAVQVALGVLESHLENPAADVETILQTVLTVPRLVEFLISAMSPDPAEKLVKWIMDEFPMSPDVFISSTAYQLLDRFSLYLLFSTYPSITDEPGNLRECRNSVELAYPVLKMLANGSFSITGSTTPEPESASEDIIITILKNKKQRGRKNSRRNQAAQTPVDRKPFENLGIEVPSDECEAAELAGSILDDQKGTLKYYLDILRYPHLRETFRTAYIPNEPTRPVLDESSRDNHGMLSTSEAVVEEAPVAYPMVQPMKAALYFDSADGFGEWRILISTRADGDLRQARKKNSALFNIILKKIRELSNGHFSDDNQKQLNNNTEAEIPIFEAKMTRDSRLVYQIDCIPEFESDVERQVIKVFGIYTHAQLDKRFWDGVGHQLGRKGREYKRRCIFRNKPQRLGENAHIILPASFPPPAESLAFTSSSGLPDLHKDDLEKLHEMLVLEKYVTFSQALLNSIIADLDVAHVFDVSPQEKEIIEHPFSCYVLGRSGTGKTTTMLFKMLGIERAWQTYQDSLTSKPRQMFVTQSRVLAEKVQEFFLKLNESISTANKSPHEIKKMTKIRQSREEQGLVDQDEEIDWRGDLPKRFSDLKDEDFPMFVTYHQLCGLLEMDLNSLSSEGLTNNLDTLGGNNELLNVTSFTSNDYMQQRRAAFISYDVFLESYWRHFPQPLTKGLDPTLVFGEFMGILKGSERTLGNDKSHLDKDTYFGLSHRAQATFARQREAIYKLFEAFLKLKRERGDYDAADRTHAILNGFRQGIPGKLLDFLYVDEAQDNLLIDALVLRSLCRNPDTGLFWAGDTAQTISIGSAFRFNDLKSFLYRIEAASVPDLSRPQPRSFQLAANYRSHAGIVNCAHSVIELLTQFWPHAIDNLVEERGIIDGLKPVFFNGWDEDSVRYEQFLFGASESPIEFGATQCILVRDDAARQRLRAQVGEIGLIMTLYESKGLEFNDVLLYNFFTDSTVDIGQWRVILNAIPESSSIKYKGPKFDDMRHNGVCRELKFLYVAITRARKNLWIADNSDKSDPMKAFWMAKEQIHTVTPGSDVPRLAVSSTPEEWAKTALVLFNNRRYTQAVHCYDRASMPREKAVAHAYHLREQARSIPANSRVDDKEREEAFIAAADAFWASAQAAVKENRAYFRISAECYSSGGDDGRAAEAYALALEYTLAARSYRKAGMFDQAVDIIKSHRSKMDQNVVSSIVDVSRLEYLRARKLKKARDLFETDEEALEFMDDYGLDIAQTALLEELGRFAEAAELHLAEGRLLDAFQAFSSDKHNPSSLQRASTCLLDGLWRGLPLGVPLGSDILNTNQTLQELLQMLTIINTEQLDDQTCDQISMFRAIVAKDGSALVRLGERFHRWHKNNAASLMCLDHVYSTTPKLQVLVLSEITTCLQSFLLYARLLQGYASDMWPCDNEDIQRLYGFQPSTTADFFLVPNETQLFDRLRDQFPPLSQQTDRGVMVFRSQLNRILGNIIRGHLQRKVLGINESCRKAKVFQPCLAYAAFGRCNRSESSECPREHISMDAYSAETFNLRVRVHLQQILIYHTVFAVEHPFEQQRHRHYWLRQLHAALNPPFYKLGALYNVNRLTIPEFEEGMQIVRIWTMEWLYSLDPYTPRGDHATSFLSSLIKATSLTFTFDSHNARDQIRRISCVQAYRPISLMRGKDGHQAYVVHDFLAFMENSGYESISQGILFAHHILENRIHLDVEVLCDFLDFLSGCLIANSRFNDAHTLHDITLPQSWLMRIAGSFVNLGKRDTKLLHMYLNPMANLLEQMYTGDNADHLLFDNRSLSKLGYQIKNVFVARICKTLCLLGYNSRSLQIRNRIWRIVTSWRHHVRKMDPIFEHYVSARSWNGLARTVRQYSTAGSSLDQMIQLHDARKTSADMPTFPNVRRIIYNKVEEIPSLLMSSAPSFPSSTLRGNAVPFIPSRQLNLDSNGETTISLVPDNSMESGQTEFPDDDEEDQENAEGLQADDESQDLDINDVSLSVDVGGASAEPIVPSEKEFKAVNVLLAAYRQLIIRRRRREHTANPTSAIRQRIFTSFQEASRSIVWPHQYYKMLFLGPIPHSLISLELARDYLHTSKSQGKRRLKTGKHQDLEDAQAYLTKISRLLKETLRLHKCLQPESDLHTRRDLEELKARILEVKQLVSELPSGATLEWQGDLELALKGIVRVKTPAVRKQKPQLNVEDDALGYDGLVIS